MNKLNNLLTIIVCAFTSSFVYSEVYQCDVEGKMVFQQIPCAIVEVVSTECDENYDYSEIVSSADATFDIRYCYYLQLDKVGEKEKQRLMQAYKQRRTEARELALREKTYDKLQSIVEKSSGYVGESDSYVKGASSYVQPIN
jgi:hypothetical protein